MIESVVAGWLANRYEIHKRPPYRAHSFDDDGRFWVVGTTRVSVLQGAHGDEEWATEIAAVLNGTPAARAYLAKGLDGGEG